MYKHIFILGGNLGISFGNKSLYSYNTEWYSIFSLSPFVGSKTCMAYSGHLFMHYFFSYNANIFLINKGFWIPCKTLLFTSSYSHSMVLLKQFILNLRATNYSIPINMSYDPKGNVFRSSCVSSPFISNWHASITLVNFLLVPMAS